MRYSVYKYIKNLSDSIVEATEYIISNPQNVTLLLDCVQAVLSIKDSLVKNKSIEIKELDMFLNIINEIADLAEKGQDYNNQLRNLYDLARKINEECTNNIKYKFKIVFFAELGSKWDAMDSVYWAYKNRDDCEVNVVLAPIFRAVKFPDGTIKSDVIYRDYLTDMGISHIPYKQYDIKKDLPDMVFSSQPYESVTPEQFWAENIAPYTRLVYLPYFTSARAMTDEEKYVQCNMPMHQLAWRMICQSESQKNVYSEFADNKGKNMIACGLPKWDWVVNMDKRKIELPKEWEKLKNKKVLLRNIHYNISDPISFLDGTRKTMKKIENEKNVAYIYRFHPMLDTMFRTYYVSYQKEWEELKKEINLSSCCVIDTNETYDCAFKFSKFLLTEGTSLMTQYLFTKKPVLVMCWERLEKRLKEEDKEETFIKAKYFYNANGTEDGEILRKKLLNGEDEQLEVRMKNIEMDFPNAGNIGRQLADKLIDEIKREDGI